MEEIKRGRGRPRIHPIVTEKRPVGRPKKTEKDRLLDKAIKTYKDIEGDLDPAMSLLPVDFCSTTTIRALRDRVRVNRFLTLKRLGIPDLQACSMVGFSRWSVSDWRTRAMKEIERRDQGFEPLKSEDDYIIFYAAYCSASLAPLASALEVIAESIQSDRNVETARWLAERQAPSDFAPTRRVEVSGRDGGGLSVSHVISLPQHRLEMLEDGKDDDVPNFDFEEGMIIEDEEDGYSTEGG